jgi:hypothetical protein
MRATAGGALALFGAMWLAGGTAEAARLKSAVVPKAPSTAVKNGRTLSDCMSLWDRGTHMTRAEWRRTCRRSLNAIELSSGDNDRKPRAKKRKRH